MTTQHQDIDLPPLPYAEIGGIQAGSSAANALEEWCREAILADRAKAMPDARWLKELEDLLHELSVQVTEDTLAGCIEGTDASHEFTQAIMAHARRRIASTTDAQPAVWQLRHLLYSGTANFWQDSSKARCLWAHDENKRREAEGQPPAWEVRKLYASAPQPSTSAPEGKA